jgi:hypothetical protein
MARTKQGNKKITKKAETRVAQPDQPKTQEEIIELLIAKIRDNLKSSDAKYVQVNENFKKVGPGLSLAGLTRLYKQEDKSSFVLVPEFKLAGSSVVVEKLLTSLGSSLASQREKNGLIDATNFETFEQVREEREKATESAPILSDKISEIAKFIKVNKGNKVGNDNNSPKKKRAQRRKSHTGITIEADPKTDVSTIIATVESVSELLKKLAEKQEGLDISSLTFEEKEGVLQALGAKAFKIKAGRKTKRSLVDWNGGHLGSTTSVALELFLKKIGVLDADVATVVKRFKGVGAAASKSTAAKSAEPKSVPKAKTSVAKTVPAAKKVAAKKDGKKEASPQKVVKAKTRDVKPRTSKDA